MLKKQIISSCRYLLKPVVRFLLRQGVSWTEFSEVSKEAYVDVARQEYGLDGRPTNNSRVSMLTGLSRREVAKVRDRLLNVTSSDDRGGNRMARILTGWHVDPEFIDSDGRPKDLLFAGPTGSMSSLLKRYAGDLPHGAVRKEMAQRGLTHELENGCVRVLKRDYIYTSLDPDMVVQLGVALHDHATTLAHNLNDERSSAPRFEGLAENAAVPAHAIDAFQKYVEGRGNDLLQDVDAWLAGQEINDAQSGGTNNVRLGVGVYLVQDEA